MERGSKRSVPRQRKSTVSGQLRERDRERERKRVLVYLIMKQINYLVTHLETIYLQVVEEPCFRMNLN